MPSFSPREIENQEFLSRVGGYDKEEVREFLRALAKEFETLLEAIEASSARDAYASEHVEELVRSIEATVSTLQGKIDEEVGALHEAQLEMKTLRSEAHRTLRNLREAIALVGQAEQALARIQKTAAEMDVTFSEPKTIVLPDTVTPAEPEDDAGPIVPRAKPGPTRRTEAAGAHPESATNGRNRDADTLPPATMKPPAQWEELLADPELDD
ncbi:MAG: DivIVA domain-containing protein [Actinomycetota bacterium]|nr:DivIVA domain-containing protein [Actinomycetota bacterium]